MADYRAVPDICCPRNILGVRYTTPQIFLVSLRIEASNMSLRTQAKAVGARWNPGMQLWFVKYEKIVGTTLEKHIQVDAKDNHRKPIKHLYVYA
jgi:lipoprotein NlpI